MFCLKLLQLENTGRKKKKKVDFYLDDIIFTRGKSTVNIAGERSMTERDFFTVSRIGSRTRRLHPRPPLPLLLPRHHANKS